jgi:hypothetical protein
MEFKHARPDSSGSDQEEQEIKVCHVPLRDVALATPQATLERLMIYGKGEEGFMEMYEEMLMLGGKSFGEIMQFLLQQAKEEANAKAESATGQEWTGKACVWHCFGELSK